MGHCPKSMQSESFDNLRAKAQEIRANTVSKVSRRIYHQSYTRFISWLIVNKPVLIVPSFLEAIGEIPADMSKLRDLVKVAMDEGSNPPIHFDQLEAPDFVSWILSLKRHDGTNLSYSALNTHRSGLFNLFREYGLVMSQTLEKEISNHFKGLKRTIAASTATGVEKIKVGKDPLSFEFFQFLCEELLRGDKREMIFARTYMIIAWNLMCRASNAFNIRHEHMEWTNDSLCIYFAHMKNDQSGERPRDPRRVYANPILPAICPILALGIYWASFEFDQSSNLLFPGDNQYDRFRKGLAILLNTPNIVAELTSRGINGNDLGTHSLRKGAATFCASGSTACPSSTAVHLRAGWSLGGVQNTYLRYEAAGDMFVGRTVCGLPIDSHEFSILPPHFASRTDTISQAIRVMFPNAPPSFDFILEFALASLVYHADYLKSSLSSTHPLFLTPLFSSQNMRSQLHALVQCGHHNVSSRIYPTGIPPHVAILTQMNNLESKIDLSITQ